MSGFVEGAKVWLEYAPEGYREARVGKVFESGDFILEDDPNRHQYRPRSDGYSAIRAARTARFSNVAGMVLLDGSPAQQRVDEERAKARRRNSIWRIKKAVEILSAKDTSDEKLAEIEQALGINEPQA